MIARHETTVGGGTSDVWGALAARIPAANLAWRKDGRSVQRDGQWIARFVCYLEAGTVRERLDAVVPGEWDLTLDLLPGLTGDGGEIEGDQRCAFKARLQILGVIRECVGSGKDYKSAATDAFKRVAVRFGIGHELYDMDPLWVPVDGDGTYAKPLEDPQALYERRAARATGDVPARTTTQAATPVARATATVATTTTTEPRATGTSTPSTAQECPKCGGPCYDNRLTKRNPKAPDFRCRDRACDGVIWPPNSRGGKLAATVASAAASDGLGEDEAAPADLEDDGLPF